MYFYSSPVFLQLPPKFSLFFFKSNCLQIMISITNTHVHLYNFCKNNVPVFPQNPWFLPQNYVLPLLIMGGIADRVSIDLLIVNHIIMCKLLFANIANCSVHELSKSLVQNHVQIRNTTCRHFWKLNGLILKPCSHVDTRHNIWDKELKKKNYFHVSGQFLLLIPNREKNGNTLATHLGTRRFSSLIFSPFYYSLHLQSLPVVTG